MSAERSGHEGSKPETETTPVGSRPNWLRRFFNWIARRPKAAQTPAEQEMSTKAPEPESSKPGTQETPDEPRTNWLGRQMRVPQAVYTEIVEPIINWFNKHPKGAQTLYTMIILGVIGASFWLAFFKTDEDDLTVVT